MESLFDLYVKYLQSAKQGIAYLISIQFIHNSCCDLDIKR